MQLEMLTNKEVVQLLQDSPSPVVRELIRRLESAPDINKPMEQTIAQSIIRQQQPAVVHDDQRICPVCRAIIDKEH